MSTTPLPRQRFRRLRSDRGPRPANAPVAPPPALLKRLRVWGPLYVLPMWGKGRRTFTLAIKVAASPNKGICLSVGLPLEWKGWVEHEAKWRWSRGPFALAVFKPVGVSP